VSLYSASCRPRTVVALCCYIILTGQGDQILNSDVNIRHPCAQCITLQLWMKRNLPWRINMKVVAVCLVHTTLIWLQYFSDVAPCSLADTRQHFRVPAPSIIRVMKAAGSSQVMLHIYRLTVGGPRWQSASLSPLWEPQISIYITFNKSLKSWPKSDWYEIVISDIKLLYVWVVWLSGCLWTSQKVLLSACGWHLRCSLQWHVCPAGMWHCALW